MLRKNRILRKKQPRSNREYDCSGEMTLKKSPAPMPGFFSCSIPTDSRSIRASHQGHHSPVRLDHKSDCRPKQAQRSSGSCLVFMPEHRKNLFRPTQLPFVSSTCNAVFRSPVFCYCVTTPDIRQAAQKYQGCLCCAATRGIDQEVGINMNSASHSNRTCSPCFVMRASHPASSPASFQSGHRIAGLRKNLRCLHRFLNSIIASRNPPNRDAEACFKPNNQNSHKNVLNDFMGSPGLYWAIVLKLSKTIDERFRTSSVARHRFGYYWRHTAG